jgi:hypothetical protein
MTVRSVIAREADIDLGSPEELFDASGFVETTPLLTPSANSYVATIRGRRFLAAVRTNAVQLPPIQVIVNWRALVRR